MFEVFAMYSLPCFWYSSCKWLSTISFEMDGKKVKNRLDRRGTYFSYWRLILDFELVFHCFGNLHIALFVWLIMQLCTAVVVFMGFYYWTNQRIFYLKNPKNLSEYSRWFRLLRWWISLEIYDMTWLVIYIVYIVTFLVLPCREIVRHQLPVASSLIVLLEQVKRWIERERDLVE